MVPGNDNLHKTRILPVFHVALVLNQANERMTPFEGTVVTMGDGGLEIARLNNVFRYILQSVTSRPESGDKSMSATTGNGLEITFNSPWEILKALIYYRGCWPSFEFRPLTQAERSFHLLSQLLAVIRVWAADSKPKATRRRLVVTMALAVKFPCHDVP